MTIDYAINNIDKIPQDKLQELLIELKQYRKTYGKAPYQYITVTKSNLAKERIYLKDIVKYQECFGIYAGVQYNTEIWCKDKTYYVVDTPMEIANKLNFIKNEKFEQYK